MVFERYAELEAAYLEILNLIINLGCHEQVQKAGIPRVRAGSGATFSALLEMQVALKSVYDTAACGDLGELRSCLLRTINTDVNTAGRILEAVPRAWAQSGIAGVRSGLFDLYLQVCDASVVPEIRTHALLNFRTLMDGALSHGDVAELPSQEHLDRLWNELQNGDINPALSNAIVETSGTIMAAVVSRDSGSLSDIEQRMRSWGDMLSECLDVDNVSLVLITACPKAYLLSMSTSRSTPGTRQQ